MPTIKQNCLKQILGLVYCFNMTEIFDQKKCYDLPDLKKKMLPAKERSL